MHAESHDEARPTAITVKAQNIPSELRDLDRWVTWKYERRDCHQFLKVTKRGIKYARTLKRFCNAHNLTELKTHPQG